MFLFNHDYLAFFGNQIYYRQEGRDCYQMVELSTAALSHPGNRVALERVLKKADEITCNRERQEQLQPKMENRRRVIRETYPDIPDVPGMDLPSLAAE